VRSWPPVAPPCRDVFLTPSDSSNNSQMYRLVFGTAVLRRCGVIVVRKISEMISVPQKTLQLKNPRIQTYLPLFCASSGLLSGLLTPIGMYSPRKTVQILISRLVLPKLYKLCPPRDDSILLL